MHTKGSHFAEFKWENCSILRLFFIFYFHISELASGAEGIVHSYVNDKNSARNLWILSIVCVMALVRLEPSYVILKLTTRLLVVILKLFFKKSFTSSITSFPYGSPQTITTLVQNLYCIVNNTQGPRSENRVQLLKMSIYQRNDFPVSGIRWVQIIFGWLKHIKKVLKLKWVNW